MAKTKGQAARPRTSAKMKIMGALSLILTQETLRELWSGKSVTIDFDPAFEFYLQLRPGSENRIVELTPWFNPEEAEIVVENSFRTDGVKSPDEFSLTGGIEFRLTESENSSVGFTVTPDQAKALATQLLEYVHAWEACRALAGKIASA